MTVTTPAPAPAPPPAAPAPVGPAFPPPGPTPADVLARVAAHRTELLDLARFDPDRRWFRRLPGAMTGAVNIEVWLLSWLPGQESPLHDHGGSSGGFAVLRGALDETEVRRDGAVRSVLRTPGAVRAFGSDHVHRVGNDGRVPAVSLHAYLPRLLEMHRYERTASGLVRRTLERAGEDW